MRSRATDAAAVVSSMPALAVGAMLFLVLPGVLLPEVPPKVPATSQLSEVPAQEVPATSQSTPATGLRAELAALLAGQSADWSRGDVEAFASIYAEDATFVAPSGMTQGRAALVARYRERYPTRAAMGTLSLEILELRQGGETVASVVARWTLAYPDKAAVSGLTLLVFHRLPAGWRIVQDASM